MDRTARGHAELKIGNSHNMLADENPSMGQGHTSAATIGASPVRLYVYLPESTAWSDVRWPKALRF